MNEELRLQYETQSRGLRADLKKWENDWATAHGGRKPGRQDIKDNPDIAEKYKEYNKVRDTLSGKVPPPPPPPPKDSESRRSKRPAQPLPSETPLKRTRHGDVSADDELMNTPAISRKLFSPASVTSLGPTPQKDGRVLGLFDLLVERELATPSRRQSETGKGTSKRHDIQATPSKHGRTLDDGGDSMLGRTPVSASKRRLLMATPVRDRGERSGGTTPSSKSRRLFETPAFLKRHSLPTLDEGTALDAPAPLKLPRKPLGRGLSEIVASLRRVEEETLDDDLEALREAENDQAGVGTAPRKPTETGSQPWRVPPGGFDDEEEAMDDSPVEDALDRNGKPMAVYKKKAPKRTTRRVNIKPTWTKRPADMDASDGGNEDDEQGDAGAERQKTRAPDAGDSDASFDEEAQGGGGGGAGKKATKGGVVKKAARKVNELAHANFHRLKLRNSGAKGGPAHNSRFRRRR